MRALVVVFAAVVVVPTAAAQPSPAITRTSIAGIHLGTSRVAAAARLAPPVQLGRLEDGYLRLGSARQRVESYFRAGTNGAVVVATWNRRLKTAERIGPCSTVAALKRAYGVRLVPFRRGGRVVAYRLGQLIFTAEDGKRVGVVALGLGTQAMYVALNAMECS